MSNQGKPYIPPASGPACFFNFQLFFYEVSSFFQNQKKVHATYTHGAPYSPVASGPDFVFGPKKNSNW